jgi:hypothetical protein
MDETSILNVASEQSASILSKDSSNNYSFLLNTTIGDHDYSDNFSPNLSMYAENVVEYIAGFVVRKLKKTLKCTACVQALLSQFSTDTCGF